MVLPTLLLSRVSRANTTIEVEAELTRRDAPLHVIASEGVRNGTSDRPDVFMCVVDFAPYDPERRR